MNQPCQVCGIKRATYFQGANRYCNEHVPSSPTRPLTIEGMKSDIAPVAIAMQAVINCLSADVMKLENRVTELEKTIENWRADS